MALRFPKHVAAEIDHLLTLGALYLLSLTILADHLLSLAILVDHLLFLAILADKTKGKEG